MAEKSLLDKVKGFFSSDDEEEKDTLKAKVAAPLPPDVTTTTTTTKATKTPIQDDSSPSDLEKKAQGYDRKFESFQKQLDTLPAFDRAFFEKKIEDVQKLQEAARNNMDNRELAEKLGHAITQLGAGMHGLKTGTDMSGIPFDKTDWTRKMESTMEDFRARQRMILDQQQAAKSDHSDTKSTLLQRGNQMLSASSNLRSADNKNLMAGLASEKTTMKTEMQAGKNYMKKKADFDKFVADLKTKKDVDPDVTVSQLRSRAMALPGVDPAVLDKLVKKAQGWGGLDSADAKDAAAAINDYVASLPTPDFSAAPAATPEAAEEQPQQVAAEVERKDPATGKIAVYDAQTKQFKRWK